MKKIVIAIVAVVVLAGGLLIYKFQKPTLNKAYQAVKDDYSSYTMEGTLSMMDGENLREYQVHVDYTCQDETEYFLEFMALEKQHSPVLLLKSDLDFLWEI